MAKIASFVLFLIVSLPLASLAQDKEPINLNLNIPIDEQLPSLDSLIEMAVAHNPTVKLNQELVGIAADKVKLERNSWTEMVRGYYDYSAGNQSLVVTGVQSSDLNNLTNGYRAGINISLPLYQLTTRKMRVRVQQQELAATEFKTQEVAIEVARLVIEEYNNVIAGQKLMKNQSEMVELARSNFQLAEADYRTGNMEGAVFIRNAEILSLAKANYENARKDFFIAVQKLELLIGTPLSDIIKSK
ncbi:MAG TPA: TolC family protein [Cyclobacteriaceae bacterium]|nr:TolC family protein [Cyclobacteriaceae bacterium]